MTRVLAILAVAAAGGCDPTATGPAEDGKAKTPADSSGKKAPGESSVKKTPAETPAADLAARIERCRVGVGERHTDAETCRLLCQDPAVDAPTTADTVLARYETCVGTCAPATTTDRTTCALNCAGSTPAVIADASAEARTCMRPCLEALADCSGGCGTESGTDRETCRLQCEANARTCVGACTKTAD